MAVWFDPRHAHRPYSTSIAGGVLQVICDHVSVGGWWYTGGFNRLGECGWLLLYVMEVLQERVVSGWVVEGYRALHTGYEAKLGEPLWGSGPALSPTMAPRAQRSTGTRRSPS